jgi:molybdate transport system substrate-binding protein
VAALLLVFGAACGGGDTEGGDQLTVLAAASLTGSFTELADRFEQEHPGVAVNLAFDSSTTLATQVVDGAPGDVLATADGTSMEIVVDAGAEESAPVEFATNTVVLVVPAGNPADVASLSDLSRDDVDWVMCDPSVPCGRIARSLVDDSGVTADPASLEVDVKAVLAKVSSDEADAGLVYATDATAAADEVRTIAIPGAASRRNSYYIAPVSDSTHAEAWIDLVTSEEGRAVLEDAGFGSP